MSDQGYAPRPLRDAVAGHIGGGTPSRQVPSYWRGQIPWASVKDFPEHSGIIDDTEEHITTAGLNSSASNLIPAGTPLVCTRMAVGRAAMPSVPMAINQDVKALFPAAGVSPAYLLKLLQFIQPKAEGQAVGSTVKGIRIQDYLNIQVPLADTDAQPTVAHILNTLDAAIHKTEVIIAKLKAVRKGLLHDLLTRGIDVNGKLRRSQAEAPHLYKPSPLGWIPMEWDVVTLESVSKTVTSGSRDWARYYADSGALFVRIGNLTREHINLRYESTIYVRPPQNADGQRTRLESGDILISITADLGIIGVVPDDFGEAYINQHIALVRPDLDEVNSRFIGHYLSGPIAQTYISKLNDAGAKAGLNLPTIRGMVTAKPHRPEQDQIAARLDEIDKRIQNATIESAKLQKLKAGLMDDLLTGRVRVSVALAPLSPADSHSLLSELCRALYQAEKRAKEEYRRELFGDANFTELLVMRRDKVKVEVRKENVSHNAPHLHISHSDKFDASISLKDFSILAGEIDKKTLKHFLKTLIPVKDQLMAIWNELNEEENSVSAEQLISNLNL